MHSHCVFDSLCLSVVAFLFIESCWGRDHGVCKYNLLPMGEKLCKLSKYNDFKIMGNGVRMGDLGASLLLSHGFMKTFPDTAKNTLSILFL